MLMLVNLYALLSFCHNSFLLYCTIIIYYYCQNAVGKVRIPGPARTQVLWARPSISSLYEI